MTLNHSKTDRRQLLGRSISSLGTIALASMLQRESRTEAASNFPTMAPRAKSVIYLYMEGGPSQIDTFDFKPTLQKYHGKELPVRAPKTVFNIGKTVMQSPFRFRRYGQSGAWVSNILPHTAKVVDDLTIVRSMHHGVSNHSSACYMSHTGYSMAGKPSMGSWISYGLGSVNDNLPSFVVLDCGQGPSGGAPSWGSGFLPSSFQGTLFTNNETPIEYIRSLESNSRKQAEKLSLLKRLATDSPRGSSMEFESRLRTFEQAFQMQSSIPRLLDLSDETKETQSLYGMDNPASKLFGSRCLLARRLVERGVRFIELFSPKVKADRWDQHGNLKDGHQRNALATDQPVAGLILDLKRRGLLDDTIVLWGGEFGRTPNQQGSNGRDHNPFGYTVWVAGGGFRAGIRFGKTDEFGYHAIENKVHIHDLHATILHQLGVNHTQLTFRHSGRDFRLTDVGGRIVRQLVS